MSFFDFWTDSRSGDAGVGEVISEWSDEDNSDRGNHQLLLSTEHASYPSGEGDENEMIM